MARIELLRCQERGRNEEIVIATLVACWIHPFKHL